MRCVECGKRLGCPKVNRPGFTGLCKKCLRPRYGVLSVGGSRNSDPEVQEFRRLLKARDDGEL